MYLGSRLDTHWSLFITVHLALIGGIIDVDRPLTKNEKIGTVFIYAGSALVNYFVMNNQALKHVIRLAENQYSGKMRLFVLLTHLVMFLMVLLSILYDKPKQKPTD